MKEMQEFLDYLEYEKRFSKHTIINYKKDINMFLENINKNKGKFYIDGKVVCEQVADTIEELCDEFVIENNGYCISDLYTIKRLLVKNKVVVYGAIWTDKGLIYVAKLNDKGELVLL